MSEQDPTAAVIERIERAWRDLLDVIAGLDAAALEAPGVTGEWSVKDLMGHIAVWDEQAALNAERRCAGGGPRQVDFQAINAEEAARRASQSLEAARAELTATHAQMLNRLRALPRVEPSWVAVDTYDHYQEHIEEIRRWRRAHGLSLP